jgi:hypothetical protein
MIARTIKEVRGFGVRNARGTTVFNRGLSSGQRGRRNRESLGPGRAVSWTLNAAFNEVDQYAASLTLGGLSGMNMSGSDLSRQPKLAKDFCNGIY